MKGSILAHVNAVYANVARSEVTERRVRCPEVSALHDVTGRLFRSLDRGEDHEREIMRLLWVLRSTVTFTLRSFGDPSLQLAEQVERILRLRSGSQGAEQTRTDMTGALENLLRVSTNPKYAYLTRMLESLRSDAGRSIAIFTSMCSGRVPGWPDGTEELLSALPISLHRIHRTADLDQRDFDIVIFPAAARNAPAPLLLEALDTGRSPRFDLLLYDCEYFRLPTRLRLPRTEPFAGRLGEESRHAAAREAMPAEADSPEEWMKESFWTEVHGGERVRRGDTVPARYVVFTEGTGIFLPEGGSVLRIDERRSLRSESDLALTPVEALREGDLVVLRVGRGHRELLDETAEEVMDEEDTEQVERAVDWKPELVKLLLTHSAREVAQMMERHGGVVGHKSVRDWAEDRVMGPGEREVMHALIRVLVEHGMLAIEPAEVTAHADFRWKCLERVRTVRQQAGTLIRKELLDAIRQRMQAGTVFGDRTNISLGQENTAMVVLRLAAVDHQTAYAPESRLRRLDELRSSKWLG